MTTQAEKARHFLALHHGDAPLLMPNPWDAGSARILASLGFAGARDDELRASRRRSAGSTAT